MPGISVRRIDKDTYDKLRKRAEDHGVSMEEEVRRILRAAIKVPDQLGSFAVDLFGSNGADLDIPERERTEPVDLHK
ncbi:MAG: FitA-like ribbon-helix-helix domain-containing protein [Spirochaetaceae bacterium]